MPNNISYRIDQEGQDSFFVDADKFNAKKDSFFKDYPDARVSEVSPYTHGETDYQPGDYFAIEQEGSEPFAVDGEKFMKKADSFVKDYPTAKISRVRPVGAWGDHVRNEYSHKAAVDSLSGSDEIDRYHTPEQEEALNKKRQLIANLRSQLESGDTANRDELKSQLRDAEKSYYNDNVILADNMRGKWGAEEANKRLEETYSPYKEQADKRKAEREANAGIHTVPFGFGAYADLPAYEDNLYAAAKNLNDDTVRLYEAPSKYGSERGIDNFMKGAKDRVSQEDFWTMELTGIVDQYQLKGVFDKIREKLGGLSNITEENIDETITPMEKELLSAFFRNAEAKSSRADISIGYKSGQSAADSALFMAQFALSGGVTAGATKALSNGAAKSLSELIAKWIGKGATKGAKKVVGKVAGAAVESAANMAFQPGTVKSVLEQQNQLVDNNKYGDVVDQHGAVIRGLADYYIENLSERSGEGINAVLGALGRGGAGLVGKIGGKELLENISKSKWSQLAKTFYNSRQLKALRAGGWNGYFGEIGEEFVGDALRTIFKVDPDALKESATTDNLIVLSTSFLPMTLLGGVANTARYGVALRGYEKSGEVFRKRMEALGFTEDQIAHITDISKAESPEDLGKTLGPVVAEMTKRGATDQDIMSAFQFANDAARLNIMEQEKISEHQVRREAKLADLTETYGDFWMGDAKTGRTVERATLPNGESGFVLGADETGEKIVKLDNGGIGYTNESGEQMSLDQYLDAAILEEDRASDEAAVIEEVATAQQALKQKISSNAPVPVGTNENPIEGVLVRDEAGAPILNGGLYQIATADEIKLMTPEELASKWGINLTPETREQKEADDVVRIESAKQRKDVYNLIPRGTEVYASLEGIENPVPYKFTRAVFNEETQEVDVIVEDLESGDEVALPESALPELEDIGAQFEAEIDAEVAAQNEQTPAATAEEGAAVAEDLPETDVPRDFRGNPLPLKEDGTVNQTDLWNKDPEAWAAWNDQQRQDGGANTAAYVQAAVNKVQGEINKIQKAYAKELDFDKREQMEGQIADRSKRLSALNGILDTYKKREAEAKAAIEAERQAEKAIEREKAAPRNAVELAASYFRNLLDRGQLKGKLNKADFKRELGWGEGELKRFFPWWAKKGKGKTLAELAEDMANDFDSETNIIPLDQNAEQKDTQLAREAIIDLLNASRTPSDVYGYVSRARSDGEERDSYADNEYAEAMAIRDKQESEEAEWMEKSAGAAELDAEELEENTNFTSYYYNEYGENTRSLEETLGPAEIGAEAVPGYRSDNAGGVLGSEGQSGEVEGSDAGAGGDVRGEGAGAVENGAVRGGGSGTAGRLEESQGRNQEGEEQGVIDFENPVQEAVQEAREEVDTNPTDAQKEAGNYRKGHVTIDGWDISIENPKGSVRSGKDADGNEWSVTMNNDYGYIRMTEGVDGDHIDVFLSDNPAEGDVYVVDQVDPKTGEFDEHKVMYGFGSAEEARDAYLANYSEGWKGLGVITGVSKDEFRKWVESSLRKTKPFSEYKSVVAEQAQGEGQSVTSRAKELAKRIADLEKKIDEMWQEWLMSATKDDSGEQKARENTDQRIGLHRQQRLAEQELAMLITGASEEDLAELEAVDDKGIREIVSNIRKEEAVKNDHSRISGIIRNEQKVPKVKAKPLGKFKPEQFLAPKGDARVMMTGTFHDTGYAVSSDATILVADKETYDKKHEGKVIARDGNEIAGKYPKWREILPSENSFREKMDFSKLRDFLAGVRQSVEEEFEKAKERGVKGTKKEAFEHTKVILNLDTNVTAAFWLGKLSAFVDYAERIGAKELSFIDDRRAVGVKTSKGIAILMPIRLDYFESVEESDTERANRLMDFSTFSYGTNEYQKSLSKEQAEKSVLAYIDNKTPEQIREEKEQQRQRPMLDRVKEWEDRTGQSIDVITRKEDVTDPTARAYIATGQAPKGWYNTATGKVVLYMPAAEGVSDIDKTYMHEIVSHKGLRELLGEDGFNSLMDSVWNDIMTEEDHAKWLAYNSHLTGSEEFLRRAAADEYVANLAENIDSNPSAWEKFVEKVKEILKKIGIELKITDADLRTLLQASLANYERQQADEKARMRSEMDAQQQRREDAEAFASGERTRAADTSAAERNPQVPISDTQEKYEDFGEKIGWAKKDLAKKGFSQKKGEGDARPAWRKKYEAANITALSDSDKEMARRMGIRTDFTLVPKDILAKGPDFSKPFVGYYVQKSKSKYGRDRMRFITDENRKPIVFSSEAQYEATIPVFEAKDQGYRVRQDGEKYKIVRPASNGKLVEYDVFDTKEEAAAFLASPEGCASLLNRKRENYELPALSELTRNNMPDYRDGKNITPDDFQRMFKFRGGEFGNWNNAAERQQALNYAYDALMDLSTVLGITPESLSLNGELSIAFGARGEGGARAHYEPTKAVINLTKMKGAGSLAHEWAHALDNYFGLMDAKQTRNRDEDVKENQMFLSEGQTWRRGARQEVRDAFRDVMKAIKEKSVTRQIALDKAQKEYDDMIGYARRQLKNQYREQFARGLTKYQYNRKTKERDVVKIVPTEEQLAEYDRLTALLEMDPTFKFDWDYKKAAYRASGDVASQLYELVKDVMPNRGGEKYGPLHNAFYYLDKALPLRERLEKAKAGETETVTIPTTVMEDSKWFDRMRAGEYYAKDIELFARAFENYVSGEMRGNGQSSDYLTYEKGPLYKEIWDHNPYPEGTERADVKMAFDHLFDTIQEKVDEQSGRTVLFRKDGWTAKEGNVYFRKGRSLLGMHNISESKLRKAMKTGGLANPSAAVIDIANQNHEDYGEISLIMPSSLVDSETGRNVGTFLGDAWTPTYPGTKKVMDEDGWEKLYEDLRKLPEEVKSRIRLDYDLYLEDDRMSDSLKWWFLKDTGRNPEIAKHVSGLQKDTRDYIMSLGERGGEVIENDREAFDRVAALFRELGDEKSVKGAQTVIEPREGATEFAKRRIDRHNKGIEEYGIAPAYVSTFFNQLYGQVRREGTVNEYETFDRAAKYIDEEGLEQEFQQWLEDKEEKYGAETKLFAGWTEDGDKKWLKNTVQNASRLMNGEPQRNAYGNNGLSATRSNVLQRMQTLSDIRKYKDLLVTPEEYDERYKEMEDELFEAIENLANRKQLSDNQFSNIDYAETRLQEAIQRRSPAAYLNAEFGYSIPVNGEYAESLKQLKKHLREMPAKYFETKFARPVMLDEFAAAVVPSDISDDTRKTLTDAGLSLFEYDPKESGSRREATMRSAQGDNILFRKAFHGSGATFERFDHAHMGDGEGAQAHGWGTYVSFNEDTAKGYATRSGRSAGYDERMAIRQSIKNLTELMEERSKANNNGAERLMQWVEDHPEASESEKNDHRKLAEALWLNDEPTYQSLERASRQRELLVNSMENAVTYKHADIHTPLEEMEVIADAVFMINNLGIATRQNFLDYYRFEYENYWKGKDRGKIYEFVESTADEDWTSNRNFYEVEIPDDTGENYLDEQADAKLTDVAEVWDALMKEAETDTAAYLNLPSFSEFNHNHTGKSNEYLYEDVARILGSKKEASKLFERIGYAGIKYDGRMDGPCAVIFNDQAVQIANHVRFRKVEDPKKIEELEAGEKEIGYRNVVMNPDGTLGSPMAGKLGKKGEKSVETSGFSFNEWEQAEENPGMATEDGKINLIKPNGKGSVDGVDYNPYIHIRPNTLNKQFTQAWRRPELVYVETQYPASELKGEYKADKAKLSVGRHEWNGGELILSRYDKPVRVVPWVEVSEDWVKEFGESGVTFDIVPPGLLPILSARGVEILPPKKAAGKTAMDAYNDWKNQNILFRKSNENQDIFISNAESALSKIKMEKATPEQWKKMLEKEGGLKAGEDKWLGLSEWLDGLDRKTVTKQDIADYIGENKIQIEEQHYGDVDASEYMRNDIQDRIGHGDSLEDIQSKIDTELRLAGDELEGMGSAEIDEWLMQQMKDRYGDDFELGYNIIEGHVEYNVDPFGEEQDILAASLDGTRPINDTRLNYTTVGLENKHEIALTVPTIEPWNQGDPVHFGDAGEGRAIAWSRFGDARGFVAEDLERVREYEHYKKEYGKEWAAAKTKLDRGVIGRMKKQAELDLIAAEQKLEKLDKDFSDVAGKSGRVLVIDEIQSKRHQEARERGYKDDSAVTVEYNNSTVGWDYYINGQNRGFISEIIAPTKEDALQLARSYVKGIPAAPFEKNWHEVALKRMLRYAAENGYDVVAWTTGDQQAERYNIGGVVEHIRNEGKQNGQTSIVIRMKSGDMIAVDVAEDGAIKKRYDNEDNQTGLGDYEGKSLSDIIGKELAVRALSLNKYEKIEGDGLRIGGEGMRGFYDDILPRFMNKYGKKWGVKVEDIFLPGLEDGLTMHSVKITPEMKASVMEGQLMFRLDDRKDGESAFDFTSRVNTELSRKYHSLASSVVVKGKENGSDGDFDREKKIITIFAKENKPMASEIEDTFFHENFHAAVDKMDDKAAFIGEFIGAAEQRFSEEDLAELKRVVEERYDESEWDEEKAANMFSALLVDGNAKIDGIPAYDEILNALRYEPEREARERSEEDEAAVPADELRNSEEEGNEGEEVTIRSAAASLVDQYDEQDGSSKYPWMSERELMDRFQEEIPYGADTEDMYALIDKYNRLDEADFDEGRRDYSGSEKDDTFEEFLAALRELAKNNIRFRITPEQDAEYMEAVNAGDMEKAQQMVDDAAKGAGYSIKAFHGGPYRFNVFDKSRLGQSTGALSAREGFFFAESRGVADGFIRDALENEDYDNIRAEIESQIDALPVDTINEIFEKFKRGEFLPVMHVTYADYIADSEDSGVEPTDIGYIESVLGDDLYSEDEVIAKREFLKEFVSRTGDGNYGDWEDFLAFLNDELGVHLGHTQGVYLKIENPLVDNLPRDYYHDSIGIDDSMTMTIMEAKEKGNDGVIFTHISERSKPFEAQYVVFEPNQIKSSDAVERDDEGNVIPLSKRFDAQSEDIRFRLGQMPEVEHGPTAEELIKKVQAFGLRGILDKEQVSDFWGFVMRALPDETRKEIVDKAFGKDFNVRRQEQDYIAELASKGYANDESGLLRLAADHLSTLISTDQPLTENDLLYMIWRGSRRYASNDILGMASDIAIRRRLGIGEYGSEKFPGKTEEIRDVAADNVLKADEERNAAREETGRKARKSPFAAINAAMTAQRNYDRETIDNIVALAKQMIKEGNISSMNAREMGRLLTIIKSANGRRTETVYKCCQQLMDFMVDHTIDTESDLLEKMMKIRTAKVKEPGIDVQAKLDLRAQGIVNAFRGNMATAEEQIRASLADIQDKLDSDNISETRKEELRAEADGLNLAIQYATEIAANEAQVEAVRQSINDARSEYNDLPESEQKRHANMLKEEVDAAYDRIRQLKIDRVNAYREMRAALAETLSEGAERAKSWLESERERIGQIHHEANSDMQGIDDDPIEPRSGFAQWLVNNQVTRLLTSPLATFDQMLRLLGRKHPDGQGYLWSRYMKQIRTANDNEKVGLDAANDTLNKKVQEIFDDPTMTWNDLYNLEKGQPTATIRFFNANGKWVEQELTPGNQLYIYMVDKMPDGQMKLRQMGITEGDVRSIKVNLDPKFIELADWVQSEFLSNLRDKYNQVHQRLFGTSMAAIENYFPLRILGGVIQENIDLSNPDSNELPSAMTGAIIKRTVNRKQLDITGADAFSVVIEHVQEMEHWAAYAELNRDLGTLLSYKRFQNQMKHLTTVYGSGKKLWGNFKKTAVLAASEYRPARTPLDEAAINIARGVSTAKIAFRAYTALKQVLSWPAFLADANTVELAKATNPAKWGENWKWAMENLPNFKKRVEKRTTGNEKLEDDDLDAAIWKGDFAKWISKYGMSMNAFVDALTVSIGAKSIYETKRKQYMAEGFDEAQADKKAKFDAVTLFNETQQSSEKEFMSTMQADRTVTSVALSVYRNSSFGYQRQVHQGLRTLSRMAQKGYKEESVAYMAKQLVREGLTEEQAAKAAEERYNRAGYQAAVRVAVFGWLVEFAWNLGAHAVYLLFGNDPDEKKAMLEEDAKKALSGGMVEGLAGGSVISDVFAKIENGESLYGYDMNTLPIMQDIKNTIGRFKTDPIAATNDLVYLAAQIGIGANPQTMSDAIVAIIDACKGDLETSKEAMLLILRILQVPQSQLDELMIDEIGMSAKDARTLSYEEIAQRYADYKVMRNAGALTPLYSDEMKEKREKAAKTTFKKKYNKRKDLKDQE